MRRLQCALLATVAAIGFASIASAADMPTKGPVYKGPVVVAAYNWTGCYIGVNAGWGRANNDLSTSVPAASAMVAAARTAIINTGATSLDGDGFTGGGQVGCNWQPVNSSFVLGVEGDFNFIDADASRNTGNFIEPASGRTVRSIDNIGMDWFATIRGRVGFAFDRILVYGTGGVAFTRLDISKNFAWDYVDGCPIVGGLQECHVGGSNSTRTGWTLGGGLEWAYNNNWSAKAEYIYADFGDVTYRTFNAGFPAIQWADHTVSTTLQVVRVGVNYKF